MRVIAGSAFALTSPVRTYSPVLYAHVELRAGGRIQVESNYSERAAYIARGRVQIEGALCETSQMIVFAKDSRPVITAIEPATVMLLGGEPVGPRHIWWNFVSSSSDRINQARADWKAGRFALPVGDDAEFIPLPEDPPPPPEPMS